MCLKVQEYRIFELRAHCLMPDPKPEIVYPFNRQYSMSAAKVCRVNSVACNLPYHIISTIEIYLVIEPII